MIVVASLLSRVWRTTELPVGKIEIDSAAQLFLDEALANPRHEGVVRIIANDPDARDTGEYESKHRAACEDHLVPADAPRALSGNVYSRRLRFFGRFARPRR